MTHSSALLDRLAPLALGLPDADPDGVLSAHLAEGCDVCLAELRELRETAILLALGIDPLNPPGELQQQIVDRVSERPYEFVMSNEGEWRVADGRELKQLYHGSRGDTSLISLRTGSWLAEAYQPGHLGYVIVRGEIDGEGLRLSVGDFIPSAGKIPGRKMAIVMDTVLLAIAGPPDAEPLDSPRAVRSGKAAWNPMEPGTYALPLAGSAAEGIEISLLRLEAGATVNRHRHEWIEELCLVSGDCRCQGVELGPEDYYRASPGTTHDVITSVGGCTMVFILREEPEVKGDK
jgi:hypothetical protein